MGNWRWIGAPIAAAYGSVLALRHVLYDEHLVPSYEPRIPTIGVGNLAVGGTGKTPMVEYLIRLLQAHGYKAGVLSRGYKRRTHGLQIASVNSTADTIGDEAMQIHRKFPDVQVVVCEERARAIRQIQNMPEHPDVIILDDAYQHRSIRCGLSILLTAYDNLYVHDHLLPWGSLRDLPFRATKANIVVVTQCPDTIRPIDKRVVDSSLKLATFQHLYFSGVEYDEVQVVGRPLLLTGIARPERLIDHVKARYPQAEVLSFADHHRFTDADRLLIKQKAEACDCILTTEKDYQRLLLSDTAELGKPVVVQPIRITVSKEVNSLDDDVLSYVRESLHKVKGER